MKRFILFLICIPLVVSCAKSKLDSETSTAEQNQAVLIDSYPGLINNIELLEPLQLQNADLQIATNWDSADIFQFIDEHRLLVGWLQYAGFLPTTIAPQHRALALYDTQEGKLIWQYERKDLSAKLGRYRVIVTTPVIILETVEDEQTTWTGLDPLTGQQRWQRQIPTPFYFTHSDQALFLAYAENEQLTLNKLDLSNGTNIWENGEFNLQNAPDTAVLQMQIYQDELLLSYHSALMSFHIKSGNLNWMRRLDNNYPITDFFLHKNQVIAFSPDTIAMFSLQHGQPRWKKALAPSHISLVIADDIQVYVIEASEHDSEVVALDIKSGQFIWVKQFKDRLRGASITKYGLALSSNSNISLVNALNGRQVWNREFSRLFESQKNRIASDAFSLHAPDLIEAHGETLYVAREESGIVAFKLNNGLLLWQQSIFQYDNETTPYTLTKKWRNFERIFKVDHKNIAYSTVDDSDPVNLTKKHSFYDAMLRHLSKRKRAKLTLSNHQFTYSHQILSAGLEIDRMGAVIQQTQTNAIFANTGAMQTHILSRLAKRGETIQKSFANMQFNLTRQVHENALQGKYYLKPFSTLDLRGITMVQLSNGHRYDLVTSPQLDIHYAPVLDPYLLSPDKSQLVTLGTSLNAQLIQKHNRRAHTLPKYSLLIYNIDKQRFTHDSLLTKRGNDFNYWGWPESIAHYSKPAPGIHKACKEIVTEPPNVYKKFLLENQNKNNGCWHYAFFEAINQYQEEQHSAAHYLIDRGFDVNQQFNLNSNTALTPLAEILDASGSKTTELNYFLNHFQPDPHQTFTYLGEIYKPLAFAHVKLKHASGKRHQQWEQEKVDLLKGYIKAWNKIHH